VLKYASTYGTTVSISSDADAVRGTSTADAVCNSHAGQVLCHRSAQSHKFLGLLKSLDKRSVLIAGTLVPLRH
jgi:hypothetical protein